MKTIALIEKAKDGTFSIFTPEIDHVIIGSGNTVQEAKTDFENSVKEMLDSYTEAGKKIPKELNGIQFEYKYDVPSIFDEYDFINVSKFAAFSGINASLLRQYKTNKEVYVSESQIQKIEDGFHKAAKSFAAIRLL